MKNVGIAAIVAALLALGTLPAANAYTANCEERLRELRDRLLADTDDLHLDEVRDAYDAAADACNAWRLGGPAIGLAVTTGTNTVATATAPAFSNLCAAGSIAYDDIPLVVTFKVGSATLTINDQGPGAMTLEEDGSVHYWVQGKVVGLDARMGSGWITIAGQGILEGGAVVKPLCTINGAGTCGGEATVESNTDRLSATGYSTFFGCL